MYLLGCLSFTPPGTMAVCFGVLQYYAHPYNIYRDNPMCQRREMIPKGHQRQSRHGEKWPLNENAKQSPRAPVSHCLNWASDRREKCTLLLLDFPAKELESVEPSVIYKWKFHRRLSNYPINVTTKGSFRLQKILNSLTGK